MLPRTVVQLYYKKSFFPFFTLTPSQMCLKRPVYRGFKCEGWCFLPSHLPSPSHSSEWNPACLGFKWAAVYCQYTYAILWVYLCYTVSIPMRYYRYQGALLFWYCFFEGFTVCPPLRYVSFRLCNNDKKSGYARHHVLHTPLFFACM